MQYRQLGQSGLLVSELCFGTMPFGAKGYWEVVGGLDQAAAQRLVDIAIDGGINFFDTADVYWAPRKTSAPLRLVKLRCPDFVL